MKIFFLCLVIFFTYHTSIAQQINDNYFEIQNHYKALIHITDTNQKVVRNNWLHRWLWNNQYEFDKNGNFDFSKNQFQEFSTNQHKILSEHNWTPIGPIDIPPTYDPRSCYSMGRVNCIAFHPTDKNIFWIGTPGGGIWKTVDYGKSWMPMSDYLGSLAISHIAVNPNNPDTIWAATGDFDISGLTSGNSIGVILSADGGTTWDISSLIKEQSFGVSTLRKILINPQSTNKLLVAGRRGIWKTIDAGISWTKVCDSIITDIEINPKNPQIVFAAMGQLYGGGTAGVIKSTDFGDTWQVLETGIPPKGQISRVEIAIAPSYPDYIYAIGVNSQTNGFHSFYCSTDGGDSWQTKSVLDTTNNILGAWGGDASDRYGQGSYDLAMIVDQNDKNTVYIGGINIWMSQTMGRNWDIASFWIYVFGRSTHADQHWVEYNPLDKSYYWCNDGGVYRTKKIFPGDKNWINDWIDKYEENIIPGAPPVQFQTQWEDLGNGLAITEFYRLSLSKNKNYVLASGSQDNSCYYFDNGKWLNYIPNYDGMETMIDHDNPDVFYGVWQNGGLCKTSDGGKTVRTRLNASIPEYGRWITPVAMDPNNSNRIFMGFRNLWESTDGGNTWQKFLDFAELDSTSLNSSTLSITQFLNYKSEYMAIYRPSYYYQDTSKAWIRVPGELWITTNNGKSWKRSKNNLPLDSMDIVGIEFSKNYPNTLYVAFNTSIRTINLYSSTDGGETWDDFSKPLPQGIRINMIKHCELIADLTPEVIYAGTNKGVYYCFPFDSVWIAFSDDLPLTIVNDLEIQMNTLEIFAATYGRGIWKTNIIAYNSVKNEQNNIIEVYPNPSKGIVYLGLPETFSLDNPTIDIKIINVLGYEVYSKTTKYEKKIELNHNLPKGVYFILMQVGKKSFNGKIVVE